MGSGISYAYDSAGRRVRKTAGGVSTYFLYDGNNLLIGESGLDGVFYGR